jgi:hypothetical protein
MISDCYLFYSDLFHTLTFPFISTEKRQEREQEKKKGRGKKYHTYRWAKNHFTEKKIKYICYGSSKRAHIFFNELLILLRPKALTN